MNFYIDDQWKFGCQEYGERLHAARIAIALSKKYSRARSRLRSSRQYIGSHNNYLLLADAKKLGPQLKQTSLVDVNAAILSARNTQEQGIQRSLKRAPMRRFRIVPMSRWYRIAHCPNDNCKKMHYWSPSGEGLINAMPSQLKQTSLCWCYHSLCTKFSRAWVSTQHWRQDRCGDSEVPMSCKCMRTWEFEVTYWFGIVTVFLCSV